MDFPADWKELLSLLASRRVKFLVVGAHALAAHAKPRITDDLDLFVEPTRKNAEKVLAALADFGFGSLDLSIDDFIQPDHVVMLGQPPLRIDLLTSISGVTFDRAWRGRVSGMLGGRRVAFLGKTEYVSNKRAAGRPKDLSDLALLGEVPIARRERKSRSRKK